MLHDCSRFMCVAGWQSLLCSSLLLQYGMQPAAAIMGLLVRDNVSSSPLILVSKDIVRNNAYIVS